MTVYEHGLALLAGRKTRTIATATKMHVKDDGSIAWQYHETDVVQAWPDGRVLLSTGGWPSATTRRRMDDALACIGAHVEGSTLRNGVLPKKARPWVVVLSHGAVVPFTDAGDSGVWVENPYNSYFEVSPFTGLPGWGSNIIDSQVQVAAFAA